MMVMLRRIGTKDITAALSTSDMVVKERVGWKLQPTMKDTENIKNTIKKYITLSSESSSETLVFQEVIL